MGSLKDRTKNLAARSRFRIGEIQVHPDRSVIVRGGEEVNLALQTMKLLVELAENSGEVVSRNRLLKNVWKNEELDDNVVYKAINELREKLDDDAGAPRYIKTVRNGGYRIIPPVVFTKHYRRQTKQEHTWFSGSPYVGLAAFDEAHADVFVGRERMREKVLQAMRSQLETGSRFLLLHGASGSGKTSLLQAGVIPSLTRPESKGDLHALAVAYCDLASAQASDPLGALAAALAALALDGLPVFPQESIHDLKIFLIETPESIGRIIDAAFQRHPDRKATENPLAHLLLVIDHGEKLVDAIPAEIAMHERFSRAVAALCDSERMLTTMIVRGDFYQKLQESLPELMELKGSQGHIDVMRPSPREIAEIIRFPAERAGLDFEEDPESGDPLDYRLCEDARGKPDVLPLLQHTLRQLYENRDEKNELLTFDAYRAMGGLEGGIAHRAEEVFASLPAEVQKSLDDVLSQLVVIQPDTGEVSGRQPSLDALGKNARTLAHAFIEARLFVSEQDDNRQPRFGVAHEALLRRWPKASGWSKKNHRLLKARAELKTAADRWDKNGRQKDHLLNPGIPLIEAMEISRGRNASLSQMETEFLAQSNRQRNFNIRIRRTAITALFILTMGSIWMAVLAMNSKVEAERQRDFSARSSAFVIGEVADRMDSTADSELILKITSIAIEYCEEMEINKAKTDELISCSRAYRKLGEVQISQSRYKEAFDNINRSVRLSERALQKAPKAKESLTEAGEAKAWLGIILRRKGDISGAISAWNDYLKVTKELVSDYSQDPKSHLQKSYALTNIGLAEIENGRYRQALKLLSESKEIKQSPAAKRREKKNEDSFELAVTASFICNIYAKSGRIIEANRCYNEQIEAIRELVEAAPEANDWRRQLASLLQYQAEVELDLGNPEQALASINMAIYDYCLLILEEPDNDDWLYYFAQAHLLAGDISRAKGNLYLAEEHFKLVEESLSFKKQPPQSWSRAIAAAQFKISRYGTNGPSNRGIESAIMSFRAMHANDKKNRKIKFDLTESLVSKAEHHRDYNDSSSSNSAAYEAIEILSAPSDREAEKDQIALLARAHFSTGKLQGACRLASHEVLKEYRNPNYLSAFPQNSNCASTIRN
jgi:DNA-binding winged helix-turn-helix (wHTH) protein/tetratricopeptide (TPR) repeat protein